MNGDNFSWSRNLSNLRMVLYTSIVTIHTASMIYCITVRYIIQSTWSEDKQLNLTRSVDSKYYGIYCLFTTNIWIKIHLIQNLYSMNTNWYETKIVSNIRRSNKALTYLYSHKHQWSVDAAKSINKKKKKKKLPRWKLEPVFILRAKNSQKRTKFGKRFNTQMRNQEKNQRKSGTKL